MLAIGRALMNHPRLLMLDEPVEGLAPVIVEEIVEQLKQIKAAGVAILLVEQNLEVCTQLADRHFVIEQGVIVYEGSNAAFAADHEVKDRYWASASRKRRALSLRGIPSMQVQDSTPGVAASGLRVDGARLWGSLMRLARIGATDKGACAASRSPNSIARRATCSPPG